MSEGAFIEAVQGGLINRVLEMLAIEPNLVLVQDNYGRNCVGSAVVEGRWELALILLRHFKVSPHKLEANGESLLHLCVRGLQIRPPTPSDFQTLRSENVALWKRDQDEDLRSIEEMKLTQSQNRPPMKILVKRVKNLEREMFGDLYLIFPKYLIEKYHVVVDRKNNSGENPAELADALGFDEIKEFFEFEMDRHMSRRRLLQGLDEDLLRQVGSYL